MPTKNARLRLDRRFTHLLSSADQSVLVGDDDAIVLEGSEARDVLPLLDGRLNAVQIARALEHKHQPLLVHLALEELEHYGVTTDADERPTSESVVMHDGHHAHAALAQRLQDEWQRRGGNDVVRLSLSAELGEAIDLLLTDDYLHSELVEHAGDRTLRHLLLARVGGVNAWIGPRIVRRVTACVTCLQERLRMNLSARALVHLDQDEASEALIVTRLPTSISDVAFHHIAEQLALFLQEGNDPTSFGHLRVLSMKGGAAATHRVDRLPDCHACGDPSLVPPGSSFELQSRPKGGRSGGGYRIQDLEETYRQYSPLISPLTGAVRHVRKVEVEGTDLVHVYTASHARHYKATSVRTLKGDGRDHSGGKGITDLDARVSALCESLERFSAVRRGHEPVRIARHSELGTEGLAPNELTLFSEAQYETREDWNARQTGHFHLVPEAYRDDPIEWSEVRSLNTGELRLVPSGFLYMGFAGQGLRFCRADSNGLAGGNCLEEAVLQGLLELIERDAVALWWYNRANVPGVDLASFGDPHIDRVVAYYPSIGRRVWALDLTTDIDVPCFAAVSARGVRERGEIVFGFGAHVDATIALRRALTEVGQMLPTVLRTPEQRREQLLPDFEDAILWWENEALNAHPYLVPGGDSEPTSLASYPPPPTTDLRDDIVECVTRVERVGLDVFVHDLTRPSVNFPVAKVIVPGLRHFWRRLGPGRLYDVPVQLGWCAQVRPESAMNPVSLFV